MIQDHIEKLRREYLGERLDEATVDRDPFLQFEKWLEAAVKADCLIRMPWSLRQLHELQNRLHELFFYGASTEMDLFSTPTIAAEKGLRYFPIRTPPEFFSGKSWTGKFVSKAW